MDRPTTALGGAAALVDLGADSRRPLPFGVFGQPGDDLLTALTRAPRDAALAGLGRPVMGGRSPAGVGTVGTLPPVLVAWPDLLTIGQVMDGTPPPEVVADEWPGFPYPVGVPVDSGVRERDRQRQRRLVLAGPEAPPAPDGSRALVVSVLTARATAGTLDQWAAVLPNGPARRVTREATAYRDYAAGAEPLIGASFAWADDLDNPALTPAFSHVPATLRGVAVRGDST